MPVDIEVAEADDVDAVVELWLSLAAGQRSYGSHIRAEPNRNQIREAIMRHIVLQELHVARPQDEKGTPEDEKTTRERGDKNVKGERDGKNVKGEENRAGVGDNGATARVVGFVMYGLETGTYAQDVTRGVVRNLYVEPAYRGDGIGAALLSVAEQSLADADAEVVALEAMADNRRARSFYDEQGYSQHRVELEKPLGKNDTHTREG